VQEVRQKLLAIRQKSYADVKMVPRDSSGGLGTSWSITEQSYDEVSYYNGI
jgi:hypothetical protein